MISYMSRRYPEVTRPIADFLSGTSVEVLLRSYVPYGSGDERRELWRDFALTGATLFTAPAEEGGLGLSFGVSVAIAHELGRATYGGQFLASLAAMEVLEAIDDDSPSRQKLADASLTACIDFRLPKLKELGTSRQERPNPAWNRTRTNILADCYPDVALLAWPHMNDAGVSIELVTRVGNEERFSSWPGAAPVFLVDVAPRSRSAKLTLEDAGDYRKRMRSSAFEEIRTRHMLRLSAFLTGLAYGAIEEAASFSDHRFTFGNKLNRYQALTHALADLSIDAQACDAAVDATTRSIEAGTLLNHGADRVAFACAEMSRRVTAKALHVFGACGLLLTGSAQLRYRLAVSYAALASIDTSVAGAWAQQLLTHPSTGHIGPTEGRNSSVYR